MIYFIQAAAGGPIKIGTTVRLTERLKQLAWECGQELQVLAIIDGSYKKERQLHRRFAQLRVVDEWFEPGDDLVGFIVAEGRSWDGSDEIPAKHTAMMRVDADTLERARLASSLMRMSLADYASDVLRKAAERDISREARKLAAGKDQ